jgi:hypothetical protein
MILAFSSGFPASGTCLLTRNDAAGPALASSENFPKE